MKASNTKAKRENSYRQFFRKAEWAWLAGFKSWFSLLGSIVARNEKPNGGAVLRPHAVTG